MDSCASSNTASPTTSATLCSYPFVSHASARETRRGVFASPARVFGLPSLLVYVFAAWIVVVVLLARIARGAERRTDRQG